MTLAPPSLRRQIFECLFYGLFVVIFLLSWMNSGYSLAAEGNFLKFGSVIKNSFFISGRESFNPFDPNCPFAFINTGSSSMLVDKGLGNIVLSDRSRIDQLLQKLNAHPKTGRAIIFDLSFDQETRADSALAHTLANTPGVYIPTPGKDCSAVLAAGLKKVRTGYIDIDVSNDWWKFSDKLSKFLLTRPDNSKSLPLIIYEDYLGRQAHRQWGMLHMGDRFFTNGITIDEHVRSYMLSDDSTNTTQVYDIEAAILTLSSDDENAANLLNKKFIVIGNFSTDIHQTVHGTAAGPVIIFNIFYSLIKQENRVRLIWLLLLLVCFSGIIHHAIYGNNPAPIRRLEGFINRIFGVVAGNIVLYIPLVMILSLISYFFLNVSIEVIAASCVITILIFLRRCVLNGWLLYKDKQKRSFHAALGFLLNNTPEQKYH